MPRSLKKKDNLPGDMLCEQTSGLTTTASGGKLYLQQGRANREEEEMLDHEEQTSVSLG